MPVAGQAGPRGADRDGRAANTPKPTSVFSGRQDAPTVALIRFLIAVGREGLSTFWTLARLMIPVMVVVKILVDLGVLPHLARLFAPVMTLVGLPAETGLVWAAAMLVNLYGGAVVLLALAPDLALSTAQATVLGTMMLIAHALPIEQRIAQKAGVGLVFSTLLRIGAAILCGALLSGLFAAGGWLQEPARLLISDLGGGGVTPGAWGDWLVGSLRTLAMILVIVLGLVLLLRSLDRLGITRRLTDLLSPVLGRVGIGGRAMPLTMVGVLLGLSYGGALIIREARSGTIPRRQVFLSLCLLSLTHSLIEDTLFIMALGGHWVGLVVGRVAFTLVVIALLDRTIDRLPPPLARRLLYAGDGPALAHNIKTGA